MHVRALLPVAVVAALAAAAPLSQTDPSAASVHGPTIAAAQVSPAPVDPAPVALAPPKRPAHSIAAVRRTLPLRRRPNGPVAARVGTSTEFGGRRVVSVAARRGPWLGVVTPELPNGRLAWVHRRNGGLSVRRTRYALHADLSGRWLELRRGGRRIRRLSVAVGRPGSETPTGRFAVTDKLSGSGYGPYYGCCILALSGHQPKLPAGWPGGNRLAIHGTDAPGTVGAAASAGCLRASDADLAVLMRRVPLGTPVFIRP